ncbi:tetratricopeptide repeat protein [Uliginosibacterium sediminicola]|uniref:protein O-GlcNAc transferase n=1 Tax=Uliginosibacterium sediminicola TaxID=2024550 RepID=A0ABU9YVG7_9RHOO
MGKEARAKALLKQQAQTGQGALRTRAEHESAAGNWHSACEAWQALLQQSPGDASTHANLAQALAHAGRHAEAVDAWAAAMHYGLPADQAAVGMADVFILRKQYDIALENLDMAIAANDGNLQAWSKRVMVCTRLGKLQEALSAAEQVLAVAPEDLNTLLSLGMLFKDAGVPEEALSWLQRAIAAAPAKLPLRSNLLWAMLHADQPSAAEILEQARQYGQLLCAEKQAGLRQAPRRRGDVLRIGWLSADLRNHAVGHFVIPVLEAFDTQRSCHIVYDNSGLDDAMSQRARRAVSQWHKVSQLGDAALAQLIQNDQLDILIDLGGHTDGTRLEVFATRLASVQISWLGYPGTTGVIGMDYVLVPPDPALLRGGWSSEEALALPDSYCVREPSYSAPPTDCTPPCLRNGYIRFGCLNNFAKVSPSAIAVWAHILQRVAHSQLLLVINGEPDGELAADIRTRFAALGVAAERLQIRGRMSPADYFASYREIDIALDSFPFNGGTTGFDALSMATPFVTLAGEALHARMGRNLLCAVGLEPLVADSIDDYIAKACALAAEPARISALHAYLGDTMPKSVLMDVPRFARGLEAIFERLLPPA